MTYQEYEMEKLREDNAFYRGTVRTAILFGVGGLIVGGPELALEAVAVAFLARMVVRR